MAVCWKDQLSLHQEDVCEALRKYQPGHRTRVGQGSERTGGFLAYQ